MDKFCGNILSVGVQAALTKLGNELAESASKTFKSTDAQRMMKDLANEIGEKYQKAINEMAAQDAPIDVTKLNELLDLEANKALRTYDAAVGATEKIRGWIDKASTVDETRIALREFRETLEGAADREGIKFRALISDAFENMSWAGKFNDADLQTAKKVVLDQHRNPLALQRHIMNSTGVDARTADRMIYEGLSKGTFEGDGAVNLVMKLAKNKIDKYVTQQMEARAPGFEALEGHVLPFMTSSSKMGSFDEFKAKMTELEVKYKGEELTISQMKNADEILNDLYIKWSDPTPGRYKAGASNLLRERSVEVPKDKEFEFAEAFLDIETDGIFNSFMLARERKMSQLAGVQNLGYKQNFVHKVLHKEILARKPELFKTVEDKKLLEKAVGDETKAIYQSTGDTGVGHKAFTEVAKVAQGLTSFGLLNKVGLRTAVESLLAGWKAGKINNASTLVSTYKILWESVSRGIRKNQLSKTLDGYAKVGIQGRMDMAHMLGAAKVQDVVQRKGVKSAGDATTALAEFAATWSGSNYMFKSQRVGILSGMVNPTMHKILKGKNLTTAEKGLLEGSGLDESARNALLLANRLDDPGGTKLKIGIDPEKPFNMDNPEVVKALRSAKRPSELTLEQTAYRLLNDEADLTRFVTNKLQTITQGISEPFKLGQVSMFFRFMNITNQEWMNMVNVMELANGRFAGMDGLGGVFKKLYHAKSKTQLALNLAKMTAYLTGAGVVMQTVRDLANGREPRDFSSIDSLTTAFLEVGGGGIGYFVGNMLYDGDIMNVPFWSAATQPAKAAALATRSLAGERLTRDEEAQLYKAIKRTSGPVLNSWYTSAIADKTAKDLFGLEVETKGGRRYRKKLGSILRPQFAPLESQRRADEQEDLF